MTVTLVAKIRRPAKRNAHLADEVAKKRDQNILHVDLPPVHVAREETGVKNQRQERKDETH